MCLKLPTFQTRRITANAVIVLLSKVIPATSTEALSFDSLNCRHLSLTPSFCLKGFKRFTTICWYLGAKLQNIIDIIHNKAHFIHLLIKESLFCTGATLASWHSYTVAQLHKHNSICRYKETIMFTRQRADEPMAYEGYEGYEGTFCNFPL
jgi:hypothetical protein